MYGATVKICLNLWDWMCLRSLFTLLFRAWYHHLS